jgi:predicted amidohydrolase
MATLTVALVHETFCDEGGIERLVRQLCRARDGGAELAVLPELPLNTWAPATRTVVAEDAEPPDGPRQRAMAEAARNAGIGLLGGVIALDPDSDSRFNRALLFDAGGQSVAAYEKLHLPSEDGFWESDHYTEGHTPPRRIDGFALPLGIQICSDLNRPQGCLMLGAQGVGVILAPRATPLSTHERWRLVLRANAVTSGAYVVSVNRPGPEAGVGIGGPSLVVAPDGEVVLESTDAVTLARLDGEAVAAARKEYPGYLAVRAELYARGWSEIAG